MTTPRLPDWQARLGAMVEARSGAAFAWGPNDCCSFAADAVIACTGNDPLRDERGAYADARAALERLETYGGIEGLGDALFGTPCPPMTARVGDTGLAVIEGRPTLVVCNGATWLGPGPDGLVALPIEAASRAWRA